MAAPRKKISRRSTTPPRVFLPLDAFIGNDAEVVFGSPQPSPQTFPQPSQQALRFEATPGGLSSPQPSTLSWTLSKKANSIFQGALTFLLVLTNVWNITLALSDAASFGCSSYYGVSIPDDLPRVCHPIVPYHKWPAFKSLEAQVSRHAQQVSGLTSMLRKVDDVLGVALGTDRDLARAPQAEIIMPLTTPSSPSSWATTIFNSFFSSQTTIYLPTVVLDSPPNTGECWQLVGDRGHIAIRLAHPARVTALSVAFPPFDELWDEKLQAPKSIHAWGHSTVSLPSTCSDHRPERPVRDFKTARLPASFNSNPHLVSLARFEYNISEPYSRQIFPVDLDQGCEMVTLDFVVIEILANWGADKTCVYHVGVHGKRP